MSDHPSAMAWRDLDPRTHPFDADVLEVAIVAAVVGYRDRMADPTIRSEVEQKIGDAIETHAGAWANGWNWVATEPGGGGPTSGWCCSSDSVFRDDDPDWRATSSRAVAALLDWRGYLEELDAVFAHLRAETASMDVATELETAMQRIVSVVVAHTTASDAWYNTLGAAIRWYIEQAQLAGDPQAIETQIERISSGRFESWVAPSASQVAEGSSELGRSLAPLLTAGPRDALAAWQIARTRPIAFTESHRQFSTIDGHTRFIAEHDRPRDPLRADRMIAALLLVRDSATSPLSFDLLSEWQRVVLGERAPVPFRTTAAFAKQGREQYGYTPELLSQFETALAEAADLSLPVTIRAARVYLDVCFFHPFADGNARAARLALDHTLSAAGLALEYAAPVFQIVRSPEVGMWELARVIDSLTTESSR